MYEIRVQSICCLSYTELVCRKSNTWNSKPSFVNTATEHLQRAGRSSMWPSLAHIWDTQSACVSSQVCAAPCAWHYLGQCWLSGPECVRESTSSHTETSASTVPWPSCISWVSQPPRKTFGFEQRTWKQPQNWSSLQGNACQWKNASQPEFCLAAAPFALFFPQGVIK